MAIVKKEFQVVTCDVPECGAFIEVTEADNWKNQEFMVYEKDLGPFMPNGIKAEILCAKCYKAFAIHTCNITVLNETFAKAFEAGFPKKTRKPRKRCENCEHIDTSEPDETGCVLTGLAVGENDPACDDYEKWTPPTKVIAAEGCPDYKPQDAPKPAAEGSTPKKTAKARKPAESKQGEGTEA